MGHIRLPHNWQADPFAGTCPYHGDCLEGLASGRAIGQRWGRPAASLPPDHAAWDLEAHYLALALVNFICTLSPQRIVMGGGVMAQPWLIGSVRLKLQEYSNEYIRSPALQEEIDSYVVSPGLGDRAGVLGAIALARQVVE
jgi:fructokinase